MFLYEGATNALVVDKEITLAYTVIAFIGVFLKKTKTKKTPLMFCVRNQLQR